ACSAIAVEWRGSPKNPPPQVHYRATIGRPPAGSSYLLLRTGDVLVLTTDGSPGCPARLDVRNRVIEPARISCTFPEAIRVVRPGDPVWFDDGKIGGVAESVDPGAVSVRITTASTRGSKLRADKGINLPESAIELPALTARDLHDLDFVVQHADAVGFS